MSSNKAFSEKVALITGGTKGIGAAVATSLVSQGAKVILVYNSDSKAAEELVQRLGGPSNALAIQGDASSLDDIDTVVSHSINKNGFNKSGKIDILIPMAGVLPMNTVSQSTVADFDRAFAVNVRGPWFLIQKCIPHINPGGKIVLVSTTQNFASSVTPPYTLYCATKGAIDQMTRVMAKDLASKDINVNAVAPGPTGTDFFYAGKSEQVLKMLASLNPRNRIGKPDEVAEAVVALSGDGAKWISGQTVRVNGGSA